MRTMTFLFRDSHHRFHLSHRNDGQNSTEQQEPNEEPTKASERNPPIVKCGDIISPVRRKKVTMKRRNDNDKSLKPHSNVHKEGNHKHNRDVSSCTLKPENLRNENVASRHRPI